MSTTTAAQAWETTAAALAQAAQATYRAALVTHPRDAAAAWSDTAATLDTYRRGAREAAAQVFQVARQTTPTGAPYPLQVADAAAHAAAWAWETAAARAQLAAALVALADAQDAAHAARVAQGYAPSGGGGALQERARAHAADAQDAADAAARAADDIYLTSSQATSERECWVDAQGDTAPAPADLVTTARDLAALVAQVAQVSGRAQRWADAAAYAALAVGNLDHAPAADAARAAARVADAVAAGSLDYAHAIAADAADHAAALGDGGAQEVARYYARLCQTLAAAN